MIRKSFIFHFSSFLFNWFFSSFRPAPVLVAAAVSWTALVVAAPILNWSVVYSAAHLVCHQIPARTFYLASGQLAVCARCLGLYLGAVGAGLLALGVGCGARLRADRPVTARWLIVAAAMPTAATLAWEWFFRWPIGNVSRFAAALPLGAMAAWLVVRALEVDWRA